MMETTPKPVHANERPINPGVKIGHVHLKVADLDRALAFYCASWASNSCSALALRQPSSPQAAIITILASTLGKAKAGVHRHLELRASTTSPLSTRHGETWRTH